MIGDNKSIVFVEKAKNITIVTKEDQSQASQVLTDINLRYKDIENKRIELVKPLNDHINKINNDFKPTLEKLKEAKKIISDKMAQWTIKENERIEAEKVAFELEAIKRREELEQEAINAVKEGNKELAEQLLTQKDKVVAKNVYDKAKVDGFHTRTTWKAKIVDIKKVPIGYMIPDMVALNKLASVCKDKTKIEGVEFYKEVVGVAK